MINVIIKKELTALAKKKQLLILLITFSILGLMSPLLALFLPEIIASALPSNLINNLPEPTSIDAWTQFFSNITQIGLIVIMIVFIGSISTEVEKGTLIPLLTKGLKRSSLIIGKYVTMMIVWTITLLLSFIICYGYTLFYFPDNLSQHVFSSVALLYSFGLFFCAILLVSSTIGKSLVSSLLIAGSFVILGIVTTFFPQLDTFTPFSLAYKNVAIIQQLTSFSDLIPALIINFTLIGLFVSFAIYCFNRKSL